MMTQSRRHTLANEEGGMKKNIVITIARQYGSGGRTVGEMLAENLGIHYYDKELMKLAAEESGIAEKLFVNADENISKKNPLLMKIMKSEYKGKTMPPESSDYTKMENLFNLQADVIRKLAETEPCVIVGRAANFVLKDCDNSVSVFVHAPHDFLMAEAAKKQPMRGRELEKFIEKTDNKKAEYYKYYTGREWNDAREYDLCLDSERLGYYKCVEEIKAYIKVRFGEDVFD
jgi:cytidylate kinase